MVILQRKINEFHKTGQEMAQYGHFDSQNIVTQSEACKRRFDLLKVGTQNSIICFLGNLSILFVDAL